MADVVPGYEASRWFCAGLRKSTPAEIVDKLNKDINAILTEAKMRARCADPGLTALTGSPDEFGRFLAEETDKWGKVIRPANIKPA